jgi:putative intracellular protease/amidase
MKKGRFLITALLLLILPACGDNGPAVEEQPEPEPIRAGVFSERGASATCVLETVEALRIDPQIEPFAVTAERLMADSLEGLDVLVFPGGSGSTQYNSMGYLLGEMVREFVLERGKGVVGICAGAYLLSDTEDYPCLRLISAGAVDIEHDKRGSALVRAEFTDRGLELFPEMEGYGTGYIQYHDGPLLVPAAGVSDSALSRHAIFISDVHISSDAPAGMSPGRIFLASQEVGKGRVFVCAGHPESTRGMRWLVPRMVRWAARKEPASYSGSVVRPRLGEREIMHDDAREKELFWKLFHEDPAARIEAMDELVKLRHRNGFRWAVGMLRDADPDVRARAAGVLAGAEYTAAIADLEVAVRQETDGSVLSVMKDCLKRLRGMRAD